MDSILLCEVVPGFRGTSPHYTTHMIKTNILSYEYRLLCYGYQDKPLIEDESRQPRAPKSTALLSLYVVRDFLCLVLAFNFHLALTLCAVPFGLAFSLLSLPSFLFF